MAKVDLSTFIIPVELDNTDENQRMGNKSFMTKDLVFLDSDSEIQGLSDEERITSPTDYAIACGASQCLDGVSRTGKKGIASYWLRSACSKDIVDSVNKGTNIEAAYVGLTRLGICPATHIFLPFFVSAKYASPIFGNIAQVQDKDGNVLYHTMEFGEYPKTKADNSDELEELFVQFKNQAKYITKNHNDGGVVYALTRVLNLDK